MCLCVVYRCDRTPLEESVRERIVSSFFYGIPDTLSSLDGRWDRISFSTLRHLILHRWQHSCNRLFLLSRQSASLFGKSFSSAHVPRKSFCVKIETCTWFISVYTSVLPSQLRSHYRLWRKIARYFWFGQVLENETIAPSYSPFPSVSKRPKEPCGVFCCRSQKSWWITSFDILTGKCSTNVLLRLRSRVVRLSFVHIAKKTKWNQQWIKNTNSNVICIKITQEYISPSVHRSSNFVSLTFLHDEKKHFINFNIRFDSFKRMCFLILYATTKIQYNNIISLSRILCTKTSI